MCATKLPTINNCTGCLSCINACKFGAISFFINKNGFAQILIDSNTCTSCGNCVKYCPVVVGGYGNNDDYKKSIPYVGWTKDETDRELSSSGGLFPALAKVVLNWGGVVVGAEMDGRSVRHVAITDEKDLPRLQGSKYLWSNCSNIYTETNKYLRQGKPVLFTGTPCQTAAMLLHADQSLRKNLYLVDLVCHGVPSNQILHAADKIFGQKIKTIISFRDKEAPWRKNFNTTFMFENNTIKRLEQKNNFFIQMFLSDSCLRSSCYSCLFVGMNRKSDLTIGDYWGTNRFSEQSHKGLSLVVQHTEKGGHLLQNARITRHKITFLDAITKNMHLMVDNSINKLYLPKYILQKVDILPTSFMSSVMCRNYRNSFISMTLYLPFALWSYVLKKILIIHNKVLFKKCRVKMSSKNVE